MANRKKATGDSSTRTTTTSNLPSVVHDGATFTPHEIEGNEMSAANTLSPETVATYQKINLIPQNARIWVPPSNSPVTIDWVSPGWLCISDIIFRFGHKLTLDTLILSVLEAI